MTNRTHSIDLCPRDSLTAFLPFALALSSKLAQWHRQGRVHSALGPQTIDWHASSSRLELRPPPAKEEYSPSENPEHRAYLAPEQTGELERPIDPRTDLYALGILFYEQLTGVHPFHDQDDQGVIQNTPRPPHEINPAIPPPLSRMVLHLLEKNPDNRYQSALGLHADLLACYEPWSPLPAAPTLSSEHAQTGRTRQEKTGRSTEEQLRIFLEKLPIALCLIDETDRIYFRNDRFIDLFGYTEEQIPSLEEWWLCACPNPDYRQWARNMWKTVQKEAASSGGRTALIEYRITCADGSEREIEVAGILLDTDFLVTFTNITERNQARRKERTARKQAETANRAKSTFLANMSHELRTPLNAILGFSEMIEHNPNVPQEVKDKISIINRCGGHLLDMINDVLDLSKIEAGATELVPEVFDLTNMLSELGRIYAARAQNLGLAFHLELNLPPVCHVRADNGKLRQSLINLLGNALKFTEEGSVLLSASVAPNPEESPTCLNIEIIVADTGPGIPAERQEEIFRPFSQAPLSAEMTQGGTGLGLAITQSFLQMMGGSVRVQSTEGEGAVFMLNLSVEQADPESAPPAAEMPPPTALQPGQAEQRILLVEDNPDNLNLLRSQLEIDGLKIHTATNGQEAIEQFKQEHPHLIWMDMRMPIMDGYEATKNIRRLPGGDAVKIIALTASVFKAEETDILAAGCDAVVHKPYRESMLFDVLEKHLAIRFEYEDLPPEAPSGCVLTAEALRALPDQLKEDLKTGALQLDQQAIEQTLETAETIHPELAEALRDVTSRYHFGQILEMLEGSPRPNPGESQ